MTIYYLSQRDMRKNRADCVHIMKTCASFSNNGYKTKLVTPFVYRKEYRISKKKIWGLYNLKINSFDITELPTLSWDEMGSKFGIMLAFFRTQLFLYTLLYFFILSVCGALKDNDIIYSKSYAMSYSLILLRKLGFLRNKLYFEKAEFIEGNSFHRKICRKVDGIIAINGYIRQNTIENYQIDHRKVFKLNFTSQYDDFKDFPKDNGNLRKELGLGITESIIMYAGKISPGMKEIYYILESARQLRNLTFFFIGAKAKSKKFFEEYSVSAGIQNARFIEFLPVRDFFSYLVCADILLSYYDSFDKLSVTQRVPAKSSLYLLTGRPIIMSDLPGLREWWNDEEIYFVKPDDPKALSKAILHILENPEEAGCKANKCMEYAKKNTYQTAYKDIIGNIQGIKV